MLGASCLGKGRPGELGQGHGSGREPVVDGVSNRGGAGARGEVGSTREGRVHANQGRGASFGRRRGQVATPAYSAAGGLGAGKQGRREERDADSGSLVNSPKFKI